MTSEEIKEQLLKACHQWLDTRSLTINKTLSEIKLAIQEETKSSAGDKHETGRAMLQIDRENAGRQLAEIEKVQHVLSRVVLKSASKKVHLGSLVKTSAGNYFIAISAGQLRIENVIYYAVAPSSPIGSMLMGKDQGEQVVFNSKKIEISFLS